MLTAKGIGSEKGSLVESRSSYAVDQLQHIKFKKCYLLIYMKLLFCQSKDMYID